MLFDGKMLKSAVDNLAGVENEIRGNLLKAVGQRSFRKSPPLSCRWKPCRKSLLRRGIPTYPFLAVI
jgi:hypothetical protein